MEITKAEHISDIEFLRAVDAVQRAQKARQPDRDYLPWATWGCQSFDEAFVAEFGPFVTDHFPEVPEKILRAKGRRVISRGLMTGCMCGCRGDMELTAEGRALLELDRGPQILPTSYAHVPLPEHQPMP